MFQVVNRGVPKAPRDTVLVPPKQTVEVEFDTNNRASGSATATTLTTSGRGWRSSSSTRVFRDSH